MVKLAMCAPQKFGAFDTGILLQGNFSALQDRLFSARWLTRLNYLELA